VAALAVLVDEVVGVGPDLLMIAGIAAVSVVFVRGSIPVALVLTLYAAPLSYAIVILVACVGAAAALAVARPLALLPAPPEESSPAEA
jgi:chloride channel protein, CIC family